VTTAQYGESRDRAETEERRLPKALDLHWISSHTCSKESAMLKDSKAVATIATSDMPAAHTFYSETLGLPVMASMEQIAAYQLPDGSAITVYLRPNHVPPENTTITFVVSDIEAEMADLRSRGVTFEDYDMPGIKTVDGLATEGMGGSSAAWFKDPAGNILSLGTIPPSP
jgi:catechol 2,3-dioxygenase-like lactoylglutathione lyase family enzyme